jgi:hypothetical protein
MISTDTADNTIQRYRLDAAISGVEGCFFFLLDLEAFNFWRSVILPALISAAIEYLKEPGFPGRNAQACSPLWSIYIRCPAQKGRQNDSYLKNLKSYHKLIN